MLNSNKISLSMLYLTISLHVLSHLFINLSSPLLTIFNLTLPTFPKLAKFVTELPKLGGINVLYYSEL